MKKFTKDEIIDFLKNKKITKDEMIELIYSLKDHGFQKITCIVLALLLLSGDTIAIEEKILKYPNVTKNNNGVFEEVTLSVTKATIENCLSYYELIEEEKDPVADILAKYNLTQEEFDIIVAVVLGEAAANSYEDAYAVINTIYNRTKSKTWINEVEKVMGLDGTSLYNQVICDGQFSVYIEDIYKDYLGVTDVPGYQAIIDFLTTEEIMHNFLSFKSNDYDPTGKVQFVENGNRYHNELSDDDRVSELSLTREKA